MPAFHILNSCHHRSLYAVCAEACNLYTLRVYGNRFYKKFKIYFILKELLGVTEIVAVFATTKKSQKKFFSNEHIPSVENKIFRFGKKYDN